MFPFNKILSREEKQKLKENHGSLETGYCLLYIKAEFEKRGYTVLTERKDLRIPLPNGRRIDFSFIIEKDGERKYVDFHNRNLDKYSYAMRLEKMLTVSKNICIVTKDIHTLYNHTKVNTFLWVRDHFGGAEGAKGKVNLHFATLEWLITNEQVWDSTEF